MTTGVYILTFSNGSTYIGKSTDMQRRWAEHGENMRKGKAAKLVQHAYNLCGPAVTRSLIVCHSDHIDIMEAYFIWKLKPNLNIASAAFLSIKDANTLKDNFKLLELSTGEHIEMLINIKHALYVSKANTYTLSLDLDNANKERSKEEILSVGMDRLMEAEREAISLSASLEYTKEALRKERSKTFWQRLFG